MNKTTRTFAFMLLMSYGHVKQLKAQTTEMQSDRAHRDLAIRWPSAYDPSAAPVFSHNEVLIRADCHRTFARLADVVAWSSWLVLVKDVANETPGKTSLGALYRLKIFGSPIQSRVVEFEADRRMSWIPLGAMRQKPATATIMLGISSRKLEIALSSRKRQASVLETARPLLLAVI